MNTIDVRNYMTVILLTADKLKRELRTAGLLSSEIVDSLSTIKQNIQCLSIELQSEDSKTPLKFLGNGLIEMPNGMSKDN